MGQQKKHIYQKIHFFKGFLVTKTAVELQHLNTKSSIIIETNEKLKLMGRKVRKVKINLSY